MYNLLLGSITEESINEILHTEVFNHIFVEQRKIFENIYLPVLLIHDCAFPDLSLDCNHAKGKWVPDTSRPFYSGFGCKQWLSAMWACRLTHRTDFAYEKLRWQPKNCKMEEFEGLKFLRKYVVILLKHFNIL